MKKTAYYGIYTALALIFSYIESLVPISLGIPGAKLGLSNLVTVFVLYHMGKQEALLISVTRICLSGLMFGNLFGILYGLSGGIFSYAAMLLCKSSQGFSVIGVSIAGGVFHNVGQILIAILVLESIQIIRYLPVLLLAGLVTGWMVGFLSKEVLSRIRREDDAIEFACVEEENR